MPYFPYGKQSYANLVDSAFPEFLPAPIAGDSLSQPKKFLRFRQLRVASRDNARRPANRRMAA